MLHGIDHEIGEGLRKHVLVAMNFDPGRGKVHVKGVASHLGGGLQDFADGGRHAA